MSLRQIQSGSRDRVRLVLSTDQTEYIYPGTYKAIEKVILQIPNGGDEVEFHIVTALDDMANVVDPRRTTPEAIALLRRHHEKQIKDQFLGQIFVDDYVVIPDDEILMVLTDKNKTFVFAHGSCWEVTPTNQLIDVKRVPDQKVVEAKLGNHKLTHSKFSYVAHSAYAEDISFEKTVDSGEVSPPSSS